MKKNRAIKKISIFYNFDVLCIYYYTYYCNYIIYEDNI